MFKNTHKISYMHLNSCNYVYLLLYINFRWHKNRAVNKIENWEDVFFTTKPTILVYLQIA